MAHPPWKGFRFTCYRAIPGIARRVEKQEPFRRVRREVLSGFVTGDYDGNIVVLVPLPERDDRCKKRVLQGGER